MYQLNVTNQAKKDLKRLDKPIIKIVLGILDDIAENPHAGEPLHGDLSHLKKVVFYSLRNRLPHCISNLRGTHRGKSLHDRHQRKFL